MGVWAVLLRRRSVERFVERRHVPIDQPQAGRRCDDRRQELRRIDMAHGSAAAGHCRTIFL